MLWLIHRMNSKSMKMKLWKSQRVDNIKQLFPEKERDSYKADESQDGEVQFSAQDHFKVNNFNVILNKLDSDFEKDLRKIFELSALFRSKLETEEYQPKDMALVHEMFTNDFFTKVFEKQIKNFKEALNVSTSDVITAGECFTSDLLRVRVTYSTTLGRDDEVVSVIVKFLNDSEEQKALNEDLQLFDNESCFYGEVFPLMAKMGFQERIGPKAYLISKSMIIMEDMSALGYKMHNRQEGLDLEHCLAVVKKLATFHAASAALQKNNPELLKKFKLEAKGKEKVIKKFISVTCPELLKVLSKVKGLQKYVTKIPTMEDFFQKLQSAKACTGAFNVLNHGDFWCNNILFQYKPDGEVKDAVFVDYQHGHIGSPFLDLHYLFGTSVKTQNKSTIIDTSLNCYLDELLSNLKKLNVDDAATREQLLEDFKIRSIMGFAALCLGVPLFRAASNANASVQNFLEEDGENSFRYHCFNSPEYVEELKELLPFYDNLGTFD
ncbi:hypothetical protein FQA39_LY11553 [Lamprigera yunnana]|nr:hypothetical protein FQA39_LY11553 [Lamprigera yunnana]